VVGDVTTELVAEDDPLVRARKAVIARPHGEISPLIASVAGVQIRAADPTSRYLDSHLAPSGHRLGLLEHAEIPVGADHGFHRARTRLRRSVR
jgi:hypothetical protein